MPHDSEAVNTQFPALLTMYKSGSVMGSEPEIITSIQLLGEPGV